MLATSTAAEMVVASPPRKAAGLVRCTPRDASRVLRQLTGGAAVEREVPGSAAHRYLDDRISKPWGHEIRVYDDRWIDVWQLSIDPGRGTSLHAHPRKDSYLVCIAGEGMLFTGAGDAIALTTGTVVRIGPGALHASFSMLGMCLLEVELPRDKFDLVRIDDRYGRAGTPYEPHRASHPEACPLLPVPGGPPQARLRRQLGGDMRFDLDLELGARARRRLDDLVVAISLDTAAVLRREPTVLAGDAAAMASHELFLTVRATSR